MADLSPEQLGILYKRTWRIAQLSKEESREVWLALDQIIEVPMTMGVNLKDVLRDIANVVIIDELRRIFLTYPMAKAFSQVFLPQLTTDLSTPFQAFSLETATAADIPRIMGALRKEKGRLEELKITLDPSRWTLQFADNFARFNPENVGNPTLQRYCNQGELIYQHGNEHLINILKIFHEIESYKFGVATPDASDESALPFVVICCSSGTGKTQLPFSLDPAFPVLYFLFNWILNPEKVNAQKIYQCFGSLSDALWACIEKDLKVLNCTEKEINTLKVKSGGKRWHTIGFIVKLLDEYLEKNTFADSWSPSLMFLAEIGSFPFIPMSCSEAATRISRLKADGKIQHLPIVFIDETYLDSKVSEKNMGQDGIVPRYLFLRSVLRESCVISIFMGTNFHLANFLSEGNLGGSRPTKSVYSMYVVYKLPPVPQITVENERDLVLELFRKNANLFRYGWEELERFVTAIFRFLAWERPWFFHEICLQLKSFLESRLTDSSEIPPDAGTFLKATFDAMVKTLYATFQEAKTASGDVTEFDYSQCCYLTAKNRLTATERAKLGLDAQLDHPFFSDLRHIHRHLAFLVPPNDLDTAPNRGSVPSTKNAALARNEMPVENEYLSRSTTPSKTFFRLLSITPTGGQNASSNEDIVAHNRYVNNKGERIPYEPYSIFPNVGRFCLSGFAMTCMLQDIPREFCATPTSKRISTYRAFHEIVAGKFTRADLQNEKYGYQLPEALVHASAIIASHSNGLENTDLATFLCTFIRELDYAAHDFDGLPMVDFSALGEDLLPLLKTKVPYLAPVDQRWNQTFIDFVRTFYPKAILGTTNYPHEGNDLFINHNNSNKNNRASTFMCAEVKFHEMDASAAFIITTANTLLCNHGKFFLLVVRSVALDIDEKLDLKAMLDEKQKQKIAPVTRTTELRAIESRQKRQQSIHHPSASSSNKVKNELSPEPEYESESEGKSASKRKSEPDFVPRGSIFLLRKTGNSFDFRLLREDKESKRIVFAMDIHTIYSGSPEIDIFKNFRG